MKPVAMPEERGKNRDMVSDAAANRVDWSSAETWEAGIVLLRVYGAVINAMLGSWGGGGGGGGDEGGAGLSDPMKRVFDAVRNLQGVGFNITSIEFGRNSKGLYGAKIAYNKGDNDEIIDTRSGEAQIVSGVFVGSNWIALPEFEESAKYLEKWMNANGIVGVGSGYIENFVKTSFGSNLKFYPSGWGGNQYVSTIKLAKAGRVLGWVTIAFGTYLDARGVVTYFTTGPNAPGAIHPAKAAFNLGVGLVGVWGGPPGWILASGYFIIDAMIDKDAPPPSGIIPHYGPGPGPICF